MKVRVETCNVKIIAGKQLKAFPLTLALSPKVAREREEERNEKQKGEKRELPFLGFSHHEPLPYIPRVFPSQ